MPFLTASGVEEESIPRLPHRHRPGRPSDRHLAELVGLGSVLKLLPAADTTG
jgi:hypothetical protein